MYYKDPELFMSQVVVDRYVDDLAYTLGISRGAMNVVRILRAELEVLLSHLDRSSERSGSR